jgi:hypothetical protein
MLGLAINAGHLLAVRGETQNAVDAAALAGADQLDGTNAGITLVTPASTNFAAAHRRDSSDPVVASAIEVGRWHRDTRSFETGVTNPADVNAVRVVSSMPETVWFAAFLGREGADAGQTNVGAQAIAVGGGPTHLKCMTLPIVVSNCEFPFTCNPGDVVRVFWGPDGTDNVAWTEGVIGNVNTSDVVDLIEAIGPEDDCDRPLDVGPEISVNNGTKTPACNAMEALIARYPGRVYFVPKIHVAVCPSPKTTKFVGDYPIEEFIGLEIMAVNCSGSPKYMDLRMRCQVRPPPGADGAGGGFTSGIDMPPRLVR